MSKKLAQQLDILIGAQAIARYVFGDRDEWRRVLSLKSELGLFRLRGQVCGRRETIAERIAAKEAPTKPEAAASSEAAA